MVKQITTGKPLHVGTGCPQPWRFAPPPCPEGQAAFRRMHGAAGILINQYAFMYYAASGAPASVVPHRPLLTGQCRTGWMPCRREILRSDRRTSGRSTIIFFFWEGCLLSLWLIRDKQEGLPCSHAQSLLRVTISLSGRYAVHATLE